MHAQPQGTRRGPLPQPAAAIARRRPPWAAPAVAAAAAAALLLACGSAPREREAGGSAGSAASAVTVAYVAPTAPAPPAAPPVGEVQARLAEGAAGLVGKSELSVRGRRFNLDCTGTVLAAYWYAGIDLARDFNRYDGNGVTRLYRTLEDGQLLYDTPVPAVGDIIFWDNTYDRNGDGKWNDEFTHVGMVTRSEADGQVEYIHFNYAKGIVMENMNLQEPAVYQKRLEGRIVIVNSPLRMRQAGVEHPERWLAGQLYRILGRGYLLDP